MNLGEKMGNLIERIKKTSTIRETDILTESKFFNAKDLIQTCLYKGIQIEINGDLFNCSIIKEPLYDPSGQKMRS